MNDQYFDSSPRCRVLAVRAQMDRCCIDRVYISCGGRQREVFPGTAINRISIGWVEGKVSDKGEEGGTGKRIRLDRFWGGWGEESREGGSSDVTGTVQALIPRASGIVPRVDEPARDSVGIEDEDGGSVIRSPAGRVANTVHGLREHVGDGVARKMVVVPAQWTVAGGGVGRTKAVGDAMAAGANAGEAKDGARRGRDERVQQGDCSVEVLALHRVVVLLVGALPIGVDGGVDESGVVTGHGGRCGPG
ncbi:hypothetical protein C8R44DRAFT_943605 [Mycena epipterygia]|nr:hypothetical protein C8R44DRAFT_943605 [Mycena epipterygia]